MENKRYVIQSVSIPGLYHEGFIRAKTTGGEECRIASWCASERDALQFLTLRQALMRKNALNEKGFCVRVVEAAHEGA